MTSHKETRIFAASPASLLALVSDAATELGGKRAKRAPADEVKVDFNKRVGDQSFVNRVQLVVRLASEAPERCAVHVEAYPVDPLGNRLLFGVLGDPARLVIDAFWGRLQARLAAR